jgi:hypothetical protein
MSKVEDRSYLRTELVAGFEHTRKTFLAGSRSQFGLACLLRALRGSYTSRGGRCVRHLSRVAIVTAESLFVGGEDVVDARVSRPEVVFCRSRN